MINLNLLEKCVDASLHLLDGKRGRAAFECGDEVLAENIATRCIVRDFLNGVLELEGEEMIKELIRNGMAAPLSKKNKYIFLSVPNFTKSADEVKGSAEMWLYLLNHARDGGELPHFGSEIVEEALDRIRVENADDKLLEAQEHDMTTKEDYECWAAGKIIAAEARGESKGHADAIDVFQELGVSSEMIAEAKARLAAKSSSAQK